MTKVDPLRIYGNLSLLEMAPVLLAAEQLYGGTAAITHGSVMALWGEASGLASLTSSGQADIATNSETQILMASAAHPDLRVIFTVAECAYRIVARRSAGIETLADLRGKRIGTQPESSADFFVTQLLHSAELTVADVTYVPFMAKTDNPVSRLPEALAEGEVDAVALWEPQIQRAYRLLDDDAVAFADPARYTEMFNLCTTQANLDDSAMRGRIEDFVQSLTAAATQLQDNPEPGWRLVADAAGLDLDMVRDAGPHVSYPGALAGDLLDRFEQQEPWVAALQGRAARGREALATFFDNTVVREITSYGKEGQRKHS